MAELVDILREALADRYALQRELGRGGMATVFLAEDRKHHRPVAIKVLHPDLAAQIGPDRFLREIEIAARLQHPHILPLYDSGEAAGFLYYVMPLVEGESLRDRLEREKQLPQEDAIRITTEVASALAYAHSHGIVHRDIKPENILLSGGTAVVADFGIARALDAAGEHPLTQTGTIIGTPAYMSPEQATGAAEIDGRSDQYSLACVLYELLVGQPPFTGPTAQAIIARHSLDNVPAPSIVRETIPEAVEDAILRALAKVPADRFRTAALFAEALNAPSAASLGTTRRRTTRATPGARRWLGMPRAVAVGVVAAALVAGGWATRALWSGNARDDTASGLDARRLAVLYFADLSRNGDLGYLADGLTEALIEQLHQVRALDVISRNGVAPFRGSALGRDSIARALAVGTLVEGSVEPVRDLVRVTVRLVDGTSGADLQRATFEQPAGSPLALRDTLAVEVARFLRERLGDEVRMREERAATRNVEAWALVQRAERLRKDADAFVQTRQMDSAAARFQRADSVLALAEVADPAWVEPIVLRGQIGDRLGRLFRNPAPIQRGLGHAARAVALAPDDPRALELRGTLRYRTWFLFRPPDPLAAAALLEDARRDLERATNTDPTLASAFSTLSHLYYQTKDLQAAALAARRAYEEDAYLSAAADILTRLFHTSYDLDQQRQAQRWCQEGARRFPRDYRFLQCQLYLMTRLEDPDIPRAWRLLAGVGALAPPPSRDLVHLRDQMLVAAVIARAGLPDSAHQVIARSRGTPEIDPEHDLLALEAFVRILLDEQDEAIRLLQRYVAANPEHSFRVGGDVFWWWWDLQKHPGFQALAKSRT